MGVRLIEDRSTGETVMYDSVTDWAFGPVFRSRGIAGAFLDWFPGDPRGHIDSFIEEKYGEFLTKNVCECGHLRITDCDLCADGVPLAPDEGTGVRYHEPIDESDVMEMCDNEAAPAPPEQYVCHRCARRRQLKAATPTEDGDHE